MSFSNNSMQEISDLANKYGHIAIDTEFVWKKTYHPELGLIQLGFSPEETFLIDTLAPFDQDILCQIIENKNIVKLLHDAKQDLMIIKNFCGANPQNIYDTRLAAGFCDMASTLSLQNILKTVLNIELDKSETCTDWLARPLSEKQIDYARNDVRYLNQVRIALNEKAEKFGTLEDMQEEMKIYDNQEIYEGVNWDKLWQKIKGCGKFDRKELAIIQQLAGYREKKAIEKNLPRTWIMADEVIIKLTEMKPQTVEEIEALNLFTPKQIKSYGNEIIQNIIYSQRIPLNDCPIPKSRKPTPDNVKITTNLALQLIKEKGIEFHIDPALVGNRAEITNFVNYCMQGKTENYPAILLGWRGKYFGLELYKAIAKRQ